jgi:hypothetical protein
MKHSITANLTSEDLNIRMAQISASNKPEEITTLACIWGFSLVTMERQYNYNMNPNVPPGPGIGLANAITCTHELINASATRTEVAGPPNDDTLYYTI